MTPPRVLVTGASGFIGSHVVDVFEEAGFDAVPLLRPSSDPRWLSDRPLERARRARLDDAEALRAAVAGCSGVVHLAGAVRARSEEEYARVNGEGTRQLLEAVARRAPGIRRFVLVSSLAAVGPSAEGAPVDEAATPHPITAYGRSKLLGESYAAEWADRLPVTVVRPPAVYGPRDRGILTFFRCAARGILPRIGRGPRVYSMVHGRDLAEGILAAFQGAAAGRIYFVADPEPYPWARLRAGFAEALGREVRSVTLPATVPRTVGLASEWLARRRGRPPFLTREKVADLVTPYWTCSPARIERELGFRTRRRLLDGLSETAEWYRRQGWLS